MKRQKQRARAQRGGALIEVLVASLIIATSLAALVSNWSFSYRMLNSTSEKSVAYNLAREALEQVKQTGFDFTAEAPTGTPVVKYYDGNQADVTSTPSGARYRVSLSVVSDRTSDGAPAADALREVTITVTAKVTGQTLCRMKTYLVKAGI